MVILGLSPFAMWVFPPEETHFFWGNGGRNWKKVHSMLLKVSNLVFSVPVVKIKIWLPTHKIDYRSLAPHRPYSVYRPPSIFGQFQFHMRVIAQCAMTRIWKIKMLSRARSPIFTCLPNIAPTWFLSKTINITYDSKEFSAMLIVVGVYGM